MAGVSYFLYVGSSFICILEIMYFFSEFYYERTGLKKIQGTFQLTGTTKHVH